MGFYDETFFICNRFDNDIRNQSAGREMQWQGPSVDFSHGRLKISDNRRYLVFEDGTPFFYLGDTGWELFHCLNKDETVIYLETAGQKDSQ